MHLLERKEMIVAAHTPKVDWTAFQAFVDEFKSETDRAAVILGPAKNDTLLAQLLDRHLLPSLSSTDELLEGDSPLATFSARINACYRLGLIASEFAKSLHFVRRIRNAFAHEVSGASLSSGARADRLKPCFSPFSQPPSFHQFREHFLGEENQASNFKSCLAVMAGRLEEAWRVIPMKWFDSDPSNDGEAAIAP
jgi:hypothetical protein